MKSEIRLGRWKYISFIIIDLQCLALANLLAAKIYLSLGILSYSYQDYISVVVIMMGIDVIVTVVFHTLKRVLRRRKRKEILESLKHVLLSFALLAFVLFSSKQGTSYSRVTIYLAYMIDFVFLVVFRILWKQYLTHHQRNGEHMATLLVTTSGYVEEGLRVLENTGAAVKGLFLTDKTNEGKIHEFPIIVDREEAVSILCWEWIKTVYICGADGMDVPEILLSACREMGISVHRAEASKSFEYEIIKIRTALQREDKSSGLSFFEGEHDIPFKISRLYTIFESDQENQKGFHAHKQSWHLLFCPYGEIDVIVDTGRERKTISLDTPSIGLILHPSIWREMIWKKSGSILCVAASGHYDADKLRDDYDEYMRFVKKKDWSAVIESAEIMGEEML